MHSAVARNEFVKRLYINCDIHEPKSLTKSQFSLLVPQSTPCKHPVIVLQDVAFTDLHALVEFIYHGEVNVHQRSLSSFLKTAEVLRVSGLTQQQAEETHNVSSLAWLSWKSNS
jgi:BTB/POZ domain